MRGSKIWRAIAITGLALFLAVQFVRPAISHPPVTAEVLGPSEVKAILRTSCYDCHSNENKLAWFDQIVPAYWLVASDIKEARRHLNFSEIGNLPPGQQKNVLYEAVNQIEAGAMPLPVYTQLHRSAIVTASQLNILKNYLRPPTLAARASASELSADDAQFEAWLRGRDVPQSVAPAPNGIAFPTDYKSWKIVSSTDRFDNQSIRVILGNPAAVKAIAVNQTNPWPDGTAFAKIAWQARADEQGKQHAGAFWQVEFMIRDRRTYAATKGWGWARWRNSELKPYGKDAAFANECVSCHTPLHDRDYVFTEINPQARALNDLPANPLKWDVITSFVDAPSGSMSTLFGNDDAVKTARSGAAGKYPAGSVLSLVSWSQREDPHWFGARVPAEVKSVEFVTLSTGETCAYEEYKGSPLTRTLPDERLAKERCAQLLSVRAAVLP